MSLSEYTVIIGFMIWIMGLFIGMFFSPSVGLLIAFLVCFASLMQL